MVDTSAAGDKEEVGDVTESEDAMMEETENEGKDDRSETQSSTNQETKTIPNAKNKETKKRKCSGGYGYCFNRNLQEDSDSKVNDGVRQTAPRGERGVV